MRTEPSWAKSNPQIPLVNCGSKWLFFSYEQGQEAYDDIRRRYRRDAEFKHTVDTYVDQFERLLAEVAGDDRESLVARTYLTSDTGKVYTMLAHAAGRFD
jgi:hypothetical protein